ncbi:hypothetical protein EVAR_44362_1 [Eumeta japonica]|uniref:Uncharacterized protein n=1 Tax=Eumeta variegata TaxID=151549 RepID=A0A4C1X8A5_EUMVA|nr:hypothetical protein EVAR_44362_1 [Eumeta japonica]
MYFFAVVIFSQARATCAVWPAAACAGCFYVIYKSTPEQRPDQWDRRVPVTPYAPAVACARSDPDPCYTPDAWYTRTKQRKVLDTTILLQLPYSHAGTALRADFRNYYTNFHTGFTNRTRDFLERLCEHFPKISYGCGVASRIPPDGQTAARKWAMEELAYAFVFF